MLDAVDGAQHVDPVVPAEGLGVAGGDRAVEVPDAGVVDQHVEGPQPFAHLAHQDPDLLLVAHVGPDECGPQPAGQLRVVRAVAEGDGGPGGQHALDGGESDPAAAAGDQHHLVAD